jgi:hypothetical protein
MLKIIFIAGILLSTIFVSSCSKSDSVNSPNITVSDKALAISIPLPKEASANLTSAEAIIFASDMDTIRSNLNVSATHITGTISNIPLGYSRKIEISVYDLNGLLAYYGEATFDILSGKPISLTIQLKAVKGTIIINGTIVDESKEFTLDRNTLVLYRLNEVASITSLKDETSRSVGAIGTGRRTDGYSKGGLSFSNGTYSSFVSDTIIPDGTPNGTIECYFKWNSTWDSTGSYAIFGNNGARCLLIFKNKQFYFIKNHSNIFKYVSGSASTRSNEWYHLSATWGSKGMRIFINGRLIGSNSDKSEYQSSPRGVSENSFYIGRKTYDGMEGVRIYSSTWFDGCIDEIRLSNIERY